MYNALLVPRSLLTHGYKPILALVVFLLTSASSRLPLQPPLKIGYTCCSDRYRGHNTRSIENFTAKAQPVWQQEEATAVHLTPLAGPTFGCTRTLGKSSNRRVDS